MNAHHDNILALKTAVNEYCRHLYNYLFTAGKLHEYAPVESIGEARRILDAALTDCDERGIDWNGVNVDAALDALNTVKGE